MATNYKQPLLSKPPADEDVEANADERTSTDSEAKQKIIEQGKLLRSLVVVVWTISGLALSELIYFPRFGWNLLVLGPIIAEAIFNIETAASFLVIFLLFLELLLALVPELIITITLGFNIFLCFLDGQQCPTDTDTTVKRAFEFLCDIYLLVWTFKVVFALVGLYTAYSASELKKERESLRRVEKVS